MKKVIIRLLTYLLVGIIILLIMGIKPTPYEYIGYGVGILILILGEFLFFNKKNVK